MIWAALRRLLAPISAWLPLIAIIVGGIAAGLGVWRVGQWRDGYLALRATQTALATRTAEAEQCAGREAVAQQALRAAAVAAESRAAEDRAIAERIEHDLQTRLAAADARGRDLARRLRDATACPGAGAVPGATDPAGQPAGASGESGRAGAVGAAVAGLAAACERDSARLDGWIEWWRAVSAERL